MRQRPTSPPPDEQVYPSDPTVVAEQMQSATTAIRAQMPLAIGLQVDDEQVGGER